MKKKKKWWRGWLADGMKPLMDKREFRHAAIGATSLISNSKRKRVDEACASFTWQYVTCCGHWEDKRMIITSLAYISCFAFTGLGGWSAKGQEGIDRSRCRHCSAAHIFFFSWLVYV